MAIGILPIQVHGLRFLVFSPIPSLEKVNSPILTELKKSRRVKRRDDETTNMIATRDESRNQDRYLKPSRLTRRNLSSATPSPRPKAHCATIGARSSGGAAEAVFSRCVVVLGIAGAHALAALVVAARGHSNSKGCRSCCIRRERAHARHSSLTFIARFVDGSVDLFRVTRR